MTFLLYEGCHGERLLVQKSRAGWDFLMNELNTDNGCTLDEALDMGLWVDGGTYEDGYVSVDDGGEISTIELTRLPLE